MYYEVRSWFPGHHIEGRGQERSRLFPKEPVYGDATLLIVE